MSLLGTQAVPYRGAKSLEGTDWQISNGFMEGADLFGIISTPIPYDEFRQNLGR
jgi:hypothetical protein